MNLIFLKAIKELDYRFITLTGCVPGKNCPTDFFYKGEIMNPYNKECEHEEMVVGGFIVTVALLVVAVILVVAQAIHGWLL